jgi:hypothetical protein
VARGRRIRPGPGVRGRDGTAQADDSGHLTAASVTSGGRAPPPAPRPSFFPLTISLSLVLRHKGS